MHNGQNVTRNVKSYQLCLNIASIFLCFWTECRRQAAVFEFRKLQLKEQSWCFKDFLTCAFKRYIQFNFIPLVLAPSSLELSTKCSVKIEPTFATTYTSFHISWRMLKNDWEKKLAHTKAIITVTVRYNTFLLDICIAHNVIKTYHRERLDHVHPRLASLWNTFLSKLQCKMYSID